MSPKSGLTMVGRDLLVGDAEGKFKGLPPLVSNNVLLVGEQGVSSARHRQGGVNDKGYLSLIST